MNKTVEIRDYLDIALRRKWLFIVPFVVITVLGVGYAYRAPQIYQASTLILVEPQKLPTTYVEPTVTDTVQDRIRTINEQITSRTFLKKIINELDLYPHMRKNLPLELVIERMRGSINVRVMERSHVFTVSYDDRDPVTAMKVANRLGSLFIEESLKVREELAEGTLIFLDKEIGRVHALLKQQERQVSQFKSRHLGVLPEQLDANLRTLDRLQNQLLSTTEALKRAEENKREIQRQIAQQRVTEQVSSPPGAETTDSDDLSVLNASLRRLRLKYTDEHPDIVSLRQKIAKIESQQSEQQATAQPAEAEEDSGSVSSISPLRRQMDAQIRRLNVEIAGFKVEENRLRALIEEHERRIDITPEVEQQLKEITRGYEVTQEEYQSLLEKRLQAELAANMERKQKGEKFRIIDHATIPETPFKPNRQKMILFAIMLAIVAGSGLVAAVEYLDTSFRKLEDLESLTDMPVIATIPHIKKMRKKAAGTGK